MGNSSAMEFMGCGVLIVTFILDCHTTIASHMSKDLINIKYYVELWHLEKSKLVTKIDENSYNVDDRDQVSSTKDELELV